jgi:hypothetical protein
MEALLLLLLVVDDDDVCASTIIGEDVGAIRTTNSHIPRIKNINDFLSIIDLTILHLAYLDSHATNLPLIYLCISSYYEILPVMVSLLSYLFAYPFVVSFIMLFDLFNLEKT